MRSASSRVAAVLMTAVFSAVYADDTVYTLSSAPQKAADWIDPAFWGGTLPPSDGTAIVVLPDGFAVKADDAAIATLNGYKVIRPGVGAELVIDIANDVDLFCAVTADTDVRVTTGTLVKKGAGTLSLKSLWKVPYRDEKKVAYKTREWDYDVNLRIEQGALKMQERLACPDDAGSAVSCHYYGDVEIWQDGILFPGSSRVTDPNTEYNKYNENCIKGLYGSGLVTNDVTGGSFCRLKPYHVGPEPAVFSGRLNGLVYFYCGGNQHLTGTSSELIGGGFRVYDNSGLKTRGILGVKKIGYNHDETSSLGRYDSLAIGESGGRLLYLGTGETTIKSFLLGDPGKDFPSVIDAGATGGLTFVGTFETREDATVHRFHLDGSNTVPCQIKCEVTPKQGICHVVKKGSGTWRMVDTPTRNRDAISGWTVENGTLQFDTIAEKGVNCSLGACNLFTEDKWCKVVDAVEVPYCFRMGTADTAGTLEYTGTDFFWVKTRPVGLGGNGRFVNAADVATYFDSGVSSVDGGTHDLILGESGTKENTVTKVTDGDGKVRVVKEGAGDWVLGGDANTFTGGIDVRAGKLTLRAPAGKFTWFRWTIRQCFLQDAGSNESEVQVNEFGIYDAAGRRINGGLRQATAQSIAKFDELHYPMLLPGEVAYGKIVSGSRYNANGKRELEKMFDDVDTSSSGLYDFCWDMIDYHGDTKVKPVETDESTWLKVIMRLDPGCAEAASYDYSGMIGGNSHRAPKSWILEGSTDGVVWWKVDEQKIDYGKRPWEDYKWIFARSNWTGGSAATHEGGQAINGSTNAVVVTYHGPVSVAAGAVLEAEGSVKIESLKVDVSQGGAIRGVEMSANMELDLENIPAGSGNLTLPLTIENCPGADSAVWTVKKSGKEAHGWTAEIGDDGMLHVTRPGMAVIIR